MKDLALTLLKKSEELIIVSPKELAETVVQNSATHMKLETQGHNTSVELYFARQHRQNTTTNLLSQLFGKSK